MLISLSVLGQSSQIVHLENHVYRYIKLLQQRGHLAELNPTKLPYTRGAVIQSLHKIDKSTLSYTEKYWADFIESELGYDDNINEEDFYLFGNLDAAFDLNNTLTKDELRPQVNEPFFLLDAAANLYMEKSGFGAQLGLSHDWFSVFDRRGERALSRFKIRSEDFYLGFKNDFIHAYAGRYTHQWSPYEETSTILSNNAHSFNNFDLTIGNNRIQLTGIFGELENISESGTFDGTINRDGIRRFLALHRIDINVNNRLRVGFFDGFLYSGKNTSPTLNYLIPTNFYFFERANNPDDEQFNYFFGGFIWGQFGNVTTNFQLMLDDIIINNPDPNVVEKANFAITHSIYIAGVFDNVDVGYESEFITYQTYNTDQAEGRYLYLSRGIANQFTDYFLFKTYLNIHAHNWLNGLTITPSIQYLLQGEQEINQTFVGTFEPIDIILTGTEEKVSRAEVSLFYTPVHWFWAGTNIGYNYTSDSNHISGNTESRFTYKLEAGFRFRLDGYSKK